MNLLFYRSYGFFARTGGNRPARTDGRTSPKKIATYLKTKVSCLKKLVEKSVNLVDAGLTVFAQGSPGAIRPVWVRVQLTKISILTKKTDVPENKNCGKNIKKIITFYRWGIHFAPLSGKRSFCAGPYQSLNVRKTVIPTIFDN